MALENSKELSAMQIEQFAAVTRNVINGQGFEGFRPVACFPDRNDIRELNGVPDDELQEPIALRWAAELANEKEEYLVAFKHSATEFKIVRSFLGHQEHQVYAVKV